jgi:hypothetical protein
MKQLIFALQFKGSGAPGADGKLRAKMSAASQAVRTAIGAQGISSASEAIQGDTAMFESVVEASNDGTFDETGTIRYGSAGSIAFKTLGRGAMGPSPLKDVQRGAVVWEVTGGDGRFAGASGLITSNFTFDASGQIVDNQFAVLFVGD